MGDIGNMPQFVNRKIETLENKDFDGGKASNQSRLSLPKGSTAELAALQRKVGLLAWDTTLGMLVVDSGAGFAPAGGGGGGAVGAAGAIQLSDGAGGFTAEAGISAGGGAMSVTGGSSQNSFRSFSSASVNELFFGRAAAFGECFVITHWPDAAIPYTDLHQYSGPSDHLTLTRDGNVGIGSSTPNGRLAIYNAQDGSGDTNPAIAIRNQLQPNDFGFDIMHKTVTTGDLLINRISSGVSSEAMRIRRDINQIQIGQPDIFATGDPSILMVSGDSNTNILTVRSNAGGAEGGFSMGSTPTYGFIQGTRSDLANVADLKINNQGGDLYLGNSAAAVIINGRVSAPDLLKIRFTKDDNQVIPNAVSTFQLVELNDSYYDNSSGAFVNGVFTVPTGGSGYYQISMNLTMESTGTGAWLSTIQMNGTEVCRGGRNNVTGTVTTGSSLSTILQLADGDVVEFGVFNETGANIQTEAFGPSNTVSIARMV